MKKILAATTHSEIEQAVKEACTKYAAYFDFTVCSETDEIIKCIDFELPEIKVIDFTSDARMDCKKLLDTNILIVQTKEQFTANFTRLLRILWQNQQFLFSRGMQGQLGASEKGSFVCANDPMDIQVYTSFLVNYLYGSNRIDTETRYKLQTVLTEMLFNALEHGNCGISFQDKTEWLEQGKNIVTLIRQKARLGENEKKRIYISYTLDTQHAEFVIRDDGEGFDWRSRVNRTVAPDTHGMGIGLSESLINKLTYNDKGNEVRFSIDTVQNTANTVPLIISPYETLNYTDKQIVCMQNERTNDLFFIVSGRYGVYADRKLVSVLTPNDMFIGEMSFLLNDKRSATVMSAGNGQLIKIPKGAFLNLIRKNPHYGIFLSKLLAQRLYIQTQKTMALDKKLKEQSE